MGRRGKIGGFGPAVWVWWLVSGAVDFRCGVDRLLVHVRDVLGREPLDGSAFVFRNRRGTRLKVLVVDAQGVWLAQRRLHRGRFVLPSTHESLSSLNRAQFAWLCSGVDWQRLSCDKSSLGKLI
jgi:transposase